MSWSWAIGTPRERADMVRSHRNLKPRPLSDEVLCELFGLTKIGLWEIATGSDWRPEFSTEAKYK
jgi:hypothetical protein